MPQDVHAPHRRDAPATIRLRQDRFELMTRVIGATTPSARAKLIGVDRKTFYRARQGVFGMIFMAQTVAALREHSQVLGECGLTASLDELFEVVDEPVAAAA